MTRLFKINLFKSPVLEHLQNFTKFYQDERDAIFIKVMKS